MTANDLTTAVERYRAARPAMKRPMRDSAEVLALGLATERDELVRLLDKRWAWLDANPGHDQFIDREDALLTILAQYEATEDALRQAASVLYGGQAA